MFLQVSGISCNSFHRCDICDLDRFKQSESLNENMEKLKNRFKLPIDNQPANREMEMEERTYVSSYSSKFCTCHLRLKDLHILHQIVSLFEYVAMKSSRLLTMYRLISENQSQTQVNFLFHDLRLAINRIWYEEFCVIAIKRIDGLLRQFKRKK